MSFQSLRTPLAIGACALALGVGAYTIIRAQAPAGAPGGGRGGAGGGSALNVFNAADTNKDGFVSRDELKAAFAQWFAAADTARAGSITQEQLATALNAAFPVPQMPAGMFSGGTGAQNQVPQQADVDRMMAALPSAAPAKPLKARKVLVLSKAAGFVHSCIPVAAKTIEMLGQKTGAWTTTVTYDPASITAENLKQYDAILLNNTTGAFLDDPNDPNVTAARKKALLDFVRAGGGLAGIHAATDSYHQAAGGGPGGPGGAPGAARGAGAPGGAPGAARGAGAPGGAPGAARGAGAPGMMGGRGAGTQLAGQIMTQADSNGDKKLTNQEMSGLADTWFDKIDTAKAGRVSQSDFTAKFASVMPPPAMPAMAGMGSTPGRAGRDTQVGTWPEFNNMIGGYFKWHWMDPTHIVYKIDDKSSPLTAMFKESPFSLDDETYTFGVNSWSRENLHVLTSVDYNAMSEADKIKEDYPREDHDYGLSWIRREGQGRVFYEAHGHNEKIYGIKTMLEHVLAGVQYSMGDLKANDAPSNPRR